MKEIIIKCPDTFTPEQIDFIKKSAMNQVEAEMKSVLKIPQVDIDAVNVKVEELKTAMNIAELVEPVEIIK